MTDDPFEGLPLARDPWWPLALFGLVLVAGIVAAVWYLAVTW